MIVKNKMFQGFLLAFLMYGNCWGMEEDFGNQIKKTSVLVSLAVINERNELLLGKQKDCDEWIIPMNLMRNKDQTIMHSIKRYMLEQAGMSVYNLSYFSNGSIIYSSGEQGIVLDYVTKNFEGRPQILSSSTRFIDWKWTSATDLPPAVRPYDEEDLSLLVRNFMER